MPLWAKQTQPGEINLIYCQFKISLDSEKQRKMKMTPLPWSLLPRLDFTPLYLTPWALPPKAIGNRGWGPSIKTPLCTPQHTSPLMCPSMGSNPPWQTCLCMGSPLLCHGCSTTSSPGAAGESSLTFMPTGLVWGFF